MDDADRERAGEDARGERPERRSDRAREHGADRQEHQGERRGSGREQRRDPFPAGREQHRSEGHEDRVEGTVGREENGEQGRPVAIRAREEELQETPGLDRAEHDRGREHGRDQRRRLAQAGERARAIAEAERPGDRRDQDRGRNEGQEVGQSGEIEGRRVPTLHLGRDRITEGVERPEIEIAQQTRDGPGDRHRRGHHEDRPEPVEPRPQHARPEPRQRGEAGREGGEDRHHEGRLDGEPEGSDRRETRDAGSGVDQIGEALDGEVAPTVEDRDRHREQAEGYEVEGGDPQQAGTVGDGEQLLQPGCGQPHGDPEREVQDRHEGGCATLEDGVAAVRFGHESARGLWDAEPPDLLDPGEERVDDAPDPVGSRAELSREQESGEEARGGERELTGRHEERPEQSGAGGSGHQAPTARGRGSKPASQVSTSPRLWPIRFKRPQISRVTRPKKAWIQRSARPTRRARPCRPKPSRVRRKPSSKKSGRAKGRAHSASGNGKPILRRKTSSLRM